MDKEYLRTKLKEFRADLIDIESSSNTIKKYITVSESFIEALKDGHELTKLDVLEYKDNLIKAGYKPNTIRTYITIINKFICYCEYETIDRKGYKSKLEVKQIREQRNFTVNNVISESELERMLKYAKRLKYLDMYLIIKIFAYTGIRENELKEFTVENLKNKTQLKIYSKGKLREITIPDQLKREINDYIKSNNIESGYIFKAPTDSSKLISARTVDWRLKKIAGAGRIAINKAHAHSFRHLFTKKLEALGYPPETIADVLGHASTETTRRYMRKNDDEMKSIMNSIHYERRSDYES